MKMKRAGLLAGSALLAVMPVGTSMAAWTAGAAIVAGLTSIAAAPAEAAGGAGGAGADASAGGSGGTISSPDGVDGDAAAQGGGGGGGAAGGGKGGTGGQIGGAISFGGTSPSQAGMPGSIGGGGGGGGAGGAHGYDDLGAALSNSGSLTGGVGGAGGIGGAGAGGGGGGGGEGGYGAFVSGTKASISDGDILGGDGGSGGIGLAGGGSGGDGGIGIYFSGVNASFTNNGTVTGGNGGAGALGLGGDGGDGGNGGAGVSGDGLIIVNGTKGSITGGDGASGGLASGGTGGDGVDGDGGAGIEGSDLTVTNGGLIGGGRSAGGTSMPAIHFTGGTNNLILLSTSKLDGDVLADGADDTLTLGGDANGDFNLYDLGTGVYSGFEHMKKTGNSIWSLEGNSSGVALDLTVEQGELRMGHPGVSGGPSTGAVYGDDVTVESGGTLSGYGLITKTLTNDGIVAPGGPAADNFGSFSVTQDYTQTANGTLRIIVTPNGASKLFVTGNADLGGGTLKLAFAPGVYSQTDYAVVHSAAGLNGSKFGSVTQNGGSVYGGVDYDANDVTLHVLNGSVGGSGGSVTVAPENGQVMGSTSTTMVLGAQASTRALFGHLNDRRLGTTDDSLRTAFAGSNPKQLAFAGDLAELNEVLAELPQALAQNGGWFRAIGGFGSIEGNNGASDIDSYGGGFMAGYDRQVTDTLLLGAAVGFSRTQIEQDGSDATVNTPRLSLYGSYQYQQVALDLSLGYGYDRIKMRNRSAGGTAKSEHDAHELVAAVQAGYAIDLPSKVVLTPRVGVDYLHLFEDGYKESGAGAFDLEAESSDTDSLKPHVGVSLAKSFATDNGWNLTPEVNLTYSREMLDDSHQAQVLVGGGSFTVEGVKLTRDELALGTNLTAELSQTFELFGGYTAILPIGNTVSHNFEAGLRAEF